jgi:hypothetical protein
MQTSAHHFAEYRKEGMDTFDCMKACYSTFGVVGHETKSGADIQSSDKHEAGDERRPEIF